MEKNGVLFEKWCVSEFTTYMNIEFSDDYRKIFLNFVEEIDMYQLDA